MSSLCKPFEYKGQSQTFLSTFSVPDKWQQGDAMQQLVKSLRRLTYVTVGKKEITSMMEPMIEMRCDFALAKRLPELVQIDLSTVWNEASASAKYAFHSYERSKSGFDGSFLAVFGAHVYTYCLHVVEKA